MATFSSESDHTRKSRTSRRLIYDVIKGIQVLGTIIGIDETRLGHMKRLKNMEDLLFSSGKEESCLSQKKAWKNIASELNGFLQIREGKYVKTWNRRGYQFQYGDLVLYKNGTKNRTLKMEKISSEDSEDVRVCVLDSEDPTGVIMTIGNKDVKMRFASEESRAMFIKQAEHMVDPTNGRELPDRLKSIIASTSTPIGEGEFYATSTAAVVARKTQELTLSDRYIREADELRTEIQKEVDSVEESPRDSSDFRALVREYNSKVNMIRQRAIPRRVGDFEEGIMVPCLVKDFRDVLKDLNREETVVKQETQPRGWRIGGEWVTEADGLEIIEIPQPNNPRSPNQGNGNNWKVKYNGETEERVIKCSDQMNYREKVVGFGFEKVKEEKQSSNPSA